MDVPGYVYFCHGACINPKIMKQTGKSRKGKENTPAAIATLNVTAPDELMKFLLKELPHKNRNNIKTLLANKQVLVDGVPVKQFNHPLVEGQVVQVNRDRIPPEKKYRGLTIVYEDHHIIVIDKHAGLLSIATDRETESTAYHMLSVHVKEQHDDNRIFVVHRLDRDTSGLMIFAKSEEVQKRMQTNWNEIVTERSYVAIVEGAPEVPEGIITSYLYESKALIVYSSQDPNKGHKAVTRYRLMKKGRGYALLQVNLETGKKNQVRVHMKEIGHPVVGDRKYGAQTDPLGRLGLHARVLAFKHPVTGEQLRFETPLPRRFLRLF